MLALLLFYGVLLGLGAIVLDVGQAYAERRQLQNGADAAALAIAHDCAVDDTCDVSPAAAEPWVDANTEGRSAAAIGGSRIVDVCASAGAWGGPCWSGTGEGALVECLDPPGPALDWSGYIEVRTQTLNDDGGSTLPRLLAGRIPEDEDATVGVGACARAAWGPVSEIDGMLPVTFSKCEWKDFTNDGTTFAPEPPYTSPPPADVVALERAIVLAEPDKDAHTCGAGPSGYDLAGGFGWLDHSSDTCTASIEIGDWVSADTGKDTPNDCKDEIYASIGTVVWIPVFDCVEKVKLCGDPSKPSGTTAWYHIWGFAAFYLTGVELSGADDAPYNSAIACTGGQRCLYGWFTHDIVPTAEIGPGPDEDTGLTAVQLVG
jgi:hypothetical protein